MRRLGLPSLWICVLLVSAPVASAAGLPAADPTGSAGPTRLSGSFSFTNDIIDIYYSENASALVDMHGFITRDPRWLIPLDSQILGPLDIDTDKLTGTYSVDLPKRPRGTLNDVDHDNHNDTGVEVFAASYWPNLVGGPYSVGNDRTRGWPTYLASVRTDSENQDEVTGGKLIVWAPDDAQRFPSGFGQDGLLFTSDDPIMAVPAGWSVIDLDSTPFKIDTSANPAATLYEPTEAALKDYSDQSYTQAFQSLFDSVSTNWAFNDIPSKHVDWQALFKKVQPKVAAAQAAHDKAAFNAAISSFINAIPDGHSGVAGPLSDAAFAKQTASGYGFSIVPLDSGKFVVLYVTPGSPAAKAGIKVGAVVTKFNGHAIAAAVAAVPPPFTFSEQSDRTYQLARYLLRAPVGTVATVTFSNPGTTAKTVKVKAIAERDSFSRTSIFSDAPIPTSPVEFSYLDSGAGYIRINTNFDDLGLIIREFEYAIKTFQAVGVEDIVIDMRWNSGGANLGLAGYFSDETFGLGQLEYYSDKTHKFEPDTYPEEVFPLSPQYDFNRIAVLVGPGCASACELEAYGFAHLPNAIVVGMYPSAGIEAEVSRGQYVLPEDITVQIPTGRFVNADGSLFLEGQGVNLDVKVPVTLNHLLATGDPVLAAAEKALSR